ncbi:MAG TPA: carbohydrate ABC transporter permease, partial [Caldilineaceae bacterium]|nr:carbohydrate ABC transporter permease [Caldilineaceae bacterium]
LTTHAEPMIQTKQPQKSTPSTIRQERWTIAGVYLFLLLFSIFILIPFLWPFLSAFTDKPENVSSLYLYWPIGFTWDHFWNAIFGRGQAFTLMRNSLVTVCSAVLLALIICSMGGYALSRARFRWKRPLMFGILLVQIIPGTATVLPFYLIMRELHLLNSLLGVVLGMTAGAIPFMLWVMKGFIDTVPIELEEAAFLDGASRFQALTRVVFPLALPGVGAASILAFNGAWGAFFLPLILLSDADKFVMPLGLFRALIAYTNLDYGMLNAMALLYMLPSFLIFIFARQYLIKGTMAGAMAGQ